MGVVYYANYLVWFEVGRTDLLRTSGWSYREMEAEGYSLPVIEAHCEYLASARYDDDLEVRTVGVLLSPVRLRFDYQVVRAGDTATLATLATSATSATLATLATGHTVHASLDASGRPRRLPDRVRSVLGV
jgi:acyl-CoA thioester hydrolase